MRNAARRPADDLERPGGRGTPTPSCEEFGPICDAEAHVRTSHRSAGRPRGHAAARQPHRLRRRRRGAAERESDLAGAGEDAGEGHLLERRARCPTSLGEDGFDALGGEVRRRRLRRSVRRCATTRRSPKEIDCAEPHSLELYNVVEVSPALTAQVKEYADLLDQKSDALPQDPRPGERPLHGRLGVRPGPAQGRRAARAARPVAQRRRRAARRVGPVPGRPVGARGSRSSCAPSSRTSPGRCAFADLTTSRLPVEARVCLNTPRKYLPCSGKHQAEDIAEMVLNTAIEKGQITGEEGGPQGRRRALRARSATREYAKLDKVCQTLLTIGLDGQGRRRGPGLPGVGVPVADGERAPTSPAASRSSRSSRRPRSRGTVFNRP